MIFLKTSDIQIIKLAQKYKTGSDSMTRLKKKEKEYLEELAKLKKKIDFHRSILIVIHSLSILFWCMLFISIGLFSTSFFKPINDYLPFWGDKPWQDIMFITFVLSIILLFSLNKLRKIEKENLKPFDWKWEDYSNMLKKTTENIQAINNRPSIEEINKEIAKIELQGRELYDKYSSYKKNEDLEAAAKFGHPIAVITLAEQYIHSKLNRVSCSSGILNYSRNENIKASLSLAEYCNNSHDYYEYKFNDKFYSPYKKEFAIVQESAVYIINIIKLSDVESDNDWHGKDMPPIFRSFIADAISSGKILSFLNESVNSYLSSAVTLSDADLKHMSNKVNEQFKPATKPSDVEWVYVPDVSDV